MRSVDLKSASRSLSKSIFKKKHESKLPFELPKGIRKVEKTKKNGAIYATYQPVHDYVNR